MNSLHTSSRQHGLTLAQWGLLIVAFMVGLGSSFAIREVFPPAHAGEVQVQAAASVDSGAVR
ncbi:MAG: hypothetical protein LBI05_09975 [Planctomycetaceae bacterium]|jgi:hypothetical protein|nr:hypothetical protein [Planctomycetaceae bacterium]